MKTFFEEFKKFITRGNVVDMAVGVIVGSSFTAIVTALSNNILKPIINWLLALLFGANSLSEVFTFLRKVYDADGNIDLANSIYIDWGAFINAVINFFLVAIVLFSIVKIINAIRENHKKATDKLMAESLTKEDKAELKRRGIKRSDKAAVKAYLFERDEAAKAKAEREKAEAEAKAKAEREKNPTAEDLLKEIRDLLKKA